MSRTILHIESSPLGERSITRKLGAKVLAQLKAQTPDLKVITRDLAAEPLPHLNGAILAGYFTPADQRDPVVAMAVAPSDKAVDEILAADVIVIGAPMWNFGIPSVLKAWIDHIARAGLTFKYTSTGPLPLIPAGKQVIVVSSRGGVYSQGPASIMDHQESYLKTVLGFLGLTDVSFVRAEGVALGEDAVKSALGAADAQIQSVLKRAAA